MRKIVTLLLACALLLSCASTLAETEIIVFAAASMTETMTTIAEMYQTEYPDVKITCNFDSSGTLKTQIQEGADCDLFISAAQKQMNQMDIEADPEVNTEGLDIVDHATRVNLLENKVTLAVPEGNPKGIESFDQVAELLKDGEIPNVKEVTTQVSENSVDCGIIYGTDAFSAGLTVVDEATVEMCGGQVIYPAAVLKTAKDAVAANAFLDYLKTDACSEVFSAVGFTPIKE